MQPYVEFANFNCTFGNTNEAMLTHFFDIIYPALTTERVMKRKDGSEWQLQDVRIERYEQEYVLVGNFIKDTVLEVKSHNDKKLGLIAADEKYPSSPYSIFMIFLRNHRMAFYRNQAGSPQIKSMQTMVDFYITRYLRQENKKRPIENQLPVAYLQVVPIAGSRSIDENIDQLVKISRIIYKIFPLNDESDVNDAFDYLREELGHVNSRSASVTISSPENKNAVKETINSLQGTAVPVVRGKTKQGTDVSFNEESFSEKLPMPGRGVGSYQENTKLIYQKVSEHEIIQHDSEDNLNLYNKLKTGFASLLKRD